MSEEPQNEELELFREPDEERPPAPERKKRKPRIISVSGAKGGCGRTVFTANLAVYLASIGRDVIAVDADEAGANLHTALGVRRLPVDGMPLGPQEDEAALRALPTSVPGLRACHAGLDEPAPGRLRRTRRRRLREALLEFDADYIVVDLGGGLPTALIDFHLQADAGVFLCIPEPTAVENTYRFVRHAFSRWMRLQVREDPAIRRELHAQLKRMGGAPPPIEFWRRLEEDGEPLADLVHGWIARFRPALVLNQTRTRSDFELLDTMRTATRRRYGIELDAMGYIDYDDTVWTSVRKGRPVLIESPGSKSAKSIEKVARRLVASESRPAAERPIRDVPPESHHDLLEVDRGATDEEVRRAFKRAKEIYAPDALCSHGLFTPEELEKVRTRLSEAFDVLLDPTRRRPYELSVFPIDEHLPKVNERKPKPKELPPPPEITPDTDFTGPLLAQLRASKGIELAEISQRSKVAIVYLEAIESERFGSLPAPVYVRGFVTEIAKYLGLDPGHVSRSYVKRYGRYLRDKE